MNLIIGLVGASGVGKGYFKKYIKGRFESVFAEPVVVSTRKRRPTDGSDRLTGVSEQDFQEMIKTGMVKFDHKPFGENGARYGFLSDSLVSDRHLLTEVHVDNVLAFRREYKDRLKLLGLYAENDYLLENLKQRATESSDEIRLRILRGISEQSRLVELWNSGNIEKLLEITRGNRHNFHETLILMISEFIK